MLGEQLKCALKITLLLKPFLYLADTCLVYTMNEIRISGTLSIEICVEQIYTYEKK